MFNINKNWKIVKISYQWLVWFKWKKLSSNVVHPIFQPKLNQKAKQTTIESYQILVELKHKFLIQ